MKASLFEDRRNTLREIAWWIGDKEVWLTL
jgi:hypothetical protein